MNDPLEIPEQIIGPDPCQVCGGEYGQHETGCRMSEPTPTPRSDREFDTINVRHTVFHLAAFHEAKEFARGLERKLVAERAAREQIVEQLKRTVSAYELELKRGKAHGTEARLQELCDSDLVRDFEDMRKERDRLRDVKWEGITALEQELAALKAEFEKVAHLIEPHWKGAGAKLESEWMIKEIVGHGKIIDDLDEQVDALKLKLEVARGALDKAMGLMDTPEHNQDSEWHQQRDEVKEALSQLNESNLEKEVRPTVLQTQPSVDDVRRVRALNESEQFAVNTGAAQSVQNTQQLNESGVQKSTTKGTLEAFKVIMDKLPKADGESEERK